MRQWNNCNKYVKLHTMLLFVAATSSAHDCVFNGIRDVVRQVMPCHHIAS